MKNKRVILAGALALTAFATAQAIPITGEIDMSGTVTLNSASLASASAANHFNGVTVGGMPNDSYAGTFGDVVMWNAFTWPGGSASPLWTFTDATTTDTYSFALSTDSIVTQTATFLNLLGTGTLSITGPGSFSPTAGIWSFTISNPTGGAHEDFNFTFANSQTSTGGVPDGGSTVMLLGAALSALALFRKNLIA
jgi:hypothetical protein